MHADKIYLSKIPIIQASTKDQNRLHNFVDQMIYLHKQLHIAENKIEKQDIIRKIKEVNSLMNEKIYRLYDFNLKDIGLIEKALTTHWRREV